jgi:hypothetical protein
LWHLILREVPTTGGLDELGNRWDEKATRSGMLKHVEDRFRFVRRSHFNLYEIDLQGFLCSNPYVNLGSETSDDGFSGVVFRLEDEGERSGHLEKRDFDKTREGNGSTLLLVVDVFEEDDGNFGIGVAEKLVTLALQEGTKFDILIPSRAISVMLRTAK